MSNNTSPFKVSVPKNLWSDVSTDVVKVIIKGTGAERLPNEILHRELKKGLIIIDEDNINISIIESKRKRYVYAKKLKYEHRETVYMFYEGHLLSLLLIDPNDTRAEITLLHMPIQTNSVVIEHIFLSMNSKWRTSGIRHAPGEQKRGDRWQLYLECDDRKSIPDEFVLNEMGPEGQDIKVKIFVNGRCVGQIPVKEQTAKLSPLQPPTTPRPPPSPHASAQTPQPTPSPESVSTHSIFSTDADNDSSTNNRHDATSLKNVHSDSVHHRPTPSPEPDPKKVKPNDTSNEDKLVLNGIELSEEQTKTLIENIAKENGRKRIRF